MLSWLINRFMLSWEFISIDFVRKSLVWLEQTRCRAVETNPSFENKICIFYRVQDLYFSSSTRFVFFIEYKIWIFYRVQDLYFSSSTRFEFFYRLQDLYFSSSTRFEFFLSSTRFVFSSSTRFAFFLLSTRFVLKVEFGLFY